MSSTNALPSKTKKKTNKLKKPAPSSSTPAGPLANVLLWTASIALVAITLVLVPGPLQDKVLVAIGKKQVTIEEHTVRTKIHTDTPRREAIVKAFKHAYFGYERSAFPSDEYHPLSSAGSNLTSSGSIGYTIIDSLSTLQLMSLSREGDTLGPSYRKARAWLKNVHTWEVDGVYSTFELTIRCLGGLLSAHWAEWEVGITPGLHSTTEEPEFSAPPGAQKISSSAPSPSSNGFVDGDEATESDHYDPSDLLFLRKALDLADRLIGAFETRSGLPLSGINLKMRAGVPGDEVEGIRGLVSLAEVGTIGLDFRYLSQTLLHQLQLLPADQLSSLTLPSFLLNEDGEPLSQDEIKRYWDLADGAQKVLREGTRGRLPSVFLNPLDGEFIISPIKLGSRGDSYFEYLLKQYLQTSKTEPDLLRMWDDSLDEIHETLLLRTPKKDLLFVAELMPERDDEYGEISWRRVPRQDHLACFLAGQLMLSAAHTRGLNGRDVIPASIPPKVSDFEPGSRAARDWKSGIDMLSACYDTQGSNSGLAPEIIHFRTKTDPAWIADKAQGEWYIKGTALGNEPPLDARYILRPEIVESIFIAYRLTADPKYRRWGWKIFEAIEKHCRVPTGGYAGVRNVDEVPVVHIDKMESFFLSETLKYLYLLFSDDSVLPLEEVVFNTEAHPLPKFMPEWDTAFM